MSLNEVQDKVLQLEGAIKRLDTVKRHLNQNASDIKGEIHSSVSRNLECLRSREVTLLLQVDQVLRVKEETLQHQQARLNQTLGVLRTGLSMILDHTASERQLAETLEKLNRIELSPEETPYISFRADHVNLRESILTYGRVDASGLPPLIAFDNNPSASLPRHVEEYEDVDHHIFYKTLEEVKRAKTSASSISVTIPKLSNRVEDWLQKKVPISSYKTGAADTTAKQRPATRPSLLAKSCDLPSVCLSGTSTPGGSCSLNSWLSLIKRHADLEEEHDFEIFDNSCSQKEIFPLVKNDLKSWLFDGSGCASKFSSTFFNHVPTDTKFWLAQARQQLTSLEELKHKDFFQDISRETSTWLRSRAHVKQNLSSQETKTADKQDDDIGDKSTNANSHCRNSCIKDDDGKWLMHSAGSTPVFQLEDMCPTSESCGNLSKCVSQPDCLRLCSKDKSAVKSASDLVHAFKPLSLTISGWPLLMSHKQASTTAESEKESCDLFSHIPDVSDSIWLMKTSSLDVSRSSSMSDIFKDNKEETNLWLQKKTSASLLDSASSVSVRSTLTSMEFCMSDWLLVPARDKEECQENLDDNKEESEA
uniref:Nuclear receptor coactivator 4 N-terminal domain-containing protein n=1 Tax=Arion vulgaris TaxID=1028688 RepID=A0A0B6Y7F5_9EUPU